MAAMVAGRQATAIPEFWGFEYGRAAPRIPRMDKAARIQRKVADACRRGSTPTAVLTAVKEALQQDVPADRWCAMSLDPATSLPTGGVHEHGFSPEHAPRLLELEFGGGDVNSLIEPGPRAASRGHAGRRDPGRQEPQRPLPRGDGARRPGA